MLILSNQNGIVSFLIVKSKHRLLYSMRMSLMVKWSLFWWYQQCPWGDHL